MTRGDIIRMAKEADLIQVVAKHDDGTITVEIPNILNMERFAALVAAAEREAIKQRVLKSDMTMANRLYVVNDLIRARGQA
jgi:hypothetical protein